MVMADYDISKAIEACKLFDDKALEFYCATGGYMEYDAVYEKRDAESESLFYPCDAEKLSTACFRFKLVSVLLRGDLRTKEDIKTLSGKCNELNNQSRKGCALGIGHVYGGLALGNVLKLNEVCSFEDQVEQQLCIEGVVTRELDNHDPPKEICEEQLEGEQKEYCLKAAEQGIYGLDRSWEIYFD